MISFILLWVIPSIALILLILLIWQQYTLHSKINELDNNFRAVVNHAFRTPLTGIKWMGDELQKDIPHKEQVLLTQNIANRIDRVLEIVDILAGVNDVQSRVGYVFKAISLQEIVEQAITRYREILAKKNISLSVSSFKDIPLLTLDTKKISFVINVLMENASQYTPLGGKITIDCHMQGKNVLFFSVSDTGIGLTHSEKHNIFKRFYRSKRAVSLNTDGMGLGLYLSKKIIKRHNGKISIKSDGIDKGTICTIMLPL